MTSLLSFHMFCVCVHKFTRADGARAADDAVSAGYGNVRARGRPFCLVQRTRWQQGPRQDIGQGTGVVPHIHSSFRFFFFYSLTLPRRNTIL